ncbi:MAG: hypothetical protein ACKUBY_00095 [Candidatus Moraniibacteriota bacterium]|jgi:hypothetical protein
MRSEKENLNHIFDLESDNIKQERELFKSMAVISAAILGVFVFNGEFVVSGYVKWGLIGFISVIIISLLLLFLIIRIERKRIRLFKELSQDVNNIKNDFYLDVLTNFSNKDFLQNNNFADFFGTLILSGVEVYGSAKKGDEKIQKINEKLQNKKGLMFFTISSWICVLVFILSLGCFIFEIFGK